MLRRLALLAGALLLALCSQSSRAGIEASPGIVAGPSLRLAGTHTFSFSPSGAVAWTLDRETVSDSGVHVRSNGIQTRTGPTASFSLPAFLGFETFYYVNATYAGVRDTDTVQVFTPDIKTWFTYHSAGNPDVRVYCAIPSSLSPATNLVLAMHGHNRTASSYCDYWRVWASQHDYIVLCPYYDLQNWPSSNDYQMGNVFAGGDCGAPMNPEERWSFTIDEGIERRVHKGFGLQDPRYDLWGFSGGGQHVHRFMIFKPNAPVRVAIAAGSGWYTAPDLSIACPYGLNSPLLSFTQPDVMRWTNRDMILMVGTADTLRDSELRVTPEADAQGLNRYQRCGYMYAKGLAFNPATHWRKIDVAGVGHSAQPMAVAAQTFLQQTTIDVPGTELPEWTGTVLRIHPNPIVQSTVLRGEGWTEGATVSVEVCDLAGRRVAGASPRVTRGAWEVAWRDLVATRRLAQGVYLVRATDREHRSQQKILVVR